MVDFLTSLGRFARVLWFDMRGVGMSDPVPDGASAPEDWVDDVTSQSWMPQASAARRSSLRDTPSQMAVMAAATHPERVDVARALQRLRAVRPGRRLSGGHAGERAGGLSSTTSSTTWGTGALGRRSRALRGRTDPESSSGGDVSSATPARRASRWRRRGRSTSSTSGTCCRSSPCRRSSSTAATTVRPGRATAAISQSTSPARGSLELDSADHWPLPEPDLLGRDRGVRHRRAVAGSGHGSRARDRRVHRRRELDRARERARRSRLAGCAGRIRAGRAEGSCSSTPAGWRTPPATASSRRSTALLAPSVARRTSATRFSAVGCTCAAGCTRGR